MTQLGSRLDSQVDEWRTRAQLAETECRRAHDLLGAIRRQVQAEGERATQCQAHMDSMQAKMEHMFSQPNDVGNHAILGVSALDPTVLRNLTSALAQVDAGKENVVELVQQLKNMCNQLRLIQQVAAEQNIERAPLTPHPALSPQEPSQAQLEAHQLHIDNTNLEAEMADMEKQMARMAYEKTHALTELAEYRAQAASSREKSYQEEKLGVHLSAENAVLRSELKRLEVQNSRLQAQLETQAVQASSLQLQLAKTEMQPSDADLASEHQVILESLQAQLASKELEAQKLRAELDSMRQDNWRKQDKRSETEQHTLMSNQQLQTTISDLEIKLGEAKTKDLQTAAKVASLQSCIDSQAHVMHSLQDQLQHRDVQAATNFSRIESLENDLINARKKAALAERHLLELERQLGEVLPELSSFKSKNDELEGELSESRRHNVELSEKISDLGRQLEDARANMETLETEGGDRVLAVQDERRADAEQYALIIEEKSQTISELQLKTQALSGEVERLQGSLAQNGSETLLIVGGLEQRVADKDQEINRHLATIRSLEEDIESFKSLLEASEHATKRALEEKETMALELAHSQSTQQEEEVMVRRLNQQLQEMKGNVRVHCRVRPLLPGEMECAHLPGAATSLNPTPVLSFPMGAAAPHALTLLNRQAVEIHGVAQGQAQGHKCGEGGSASGPPRHVFGFDRVFTPSCTQQEVFDDIAGLVRSALDGERVCIFAYGQTGSGKTFTMLGDGDGEGRGVIPRALELIFQRSRQLKEHGWEFAMHASMLEIYNETIRDLLADNAGEWGSAQKPLAPKSSYSIQHDAAGNTTVQDLVVREVSSQEDVQELMASAAKHRSSAATGMNDSSSRSHCVFTLRLEGRRLNGGGGARYTSGRLNLIDLAGSERLSRSGATGERLKETQAINKSLSSLGDVISALVRKEPHIPYRNSKLTYLLQPCLGGNSKTLMFLNIAPTAASAGETLCSARFGEKVMGAELNMPHGKASIGKLGLSKGSPSKHWATIKKATKRVVDSGEDTTAAEVWHQEDD